MKRLLLPFIISTTILISEPSLFAQTAPAKQWDKTIGGTASDYINSLAQTSDGGYIIGGNSLSNIGGDKSQPSFLNSWDYWIVKLNPTGNKVWDKTFGTIGIESLNSI